MDIQGIFFEITERNILFEEAVLNFKANIQGMRLFLNIFLLKIALF